MTILGSPEGARITSRICHSGLVGPGLPAPGTEFVGIQLPFLRKMVFNYGAPRRKERKRRWGQLLRLGPGHGLEQGKTRRKSQRPPSLPGVASPTPPRSGDAGKMPHTGPSAPGGGSPSEDQAVPHPASGIRARTGLPTLRLPEAGRGVLC